MASVQGRGGSGGLTSVTFGSFLGGLGGTRAAARFAFADPLGVGRPEAAGGTVSGAGGVAVAGATAGGAAGVALAASPLLACQVFGAGNISRFSQNKGNPPATMATMIRGNAGIRDFGLALMGEVLPEVVGTAAEPVSPDASGALSFFGKACPQNSHTSALTLLILPHSGFGQILR